MKHLLLISLVFAFACDPSPKERSTRDILRPPAPVPAATAPVVQAEAATSLYDLDLSLVDQDGRRLRFDAFRGHPVVVAMFYGTCPYACPMLISDIKRALAHSDPDARGSFRVLLVSFDPDRDTPHAMKELATLHEINVPSWRLTRAENGKERELAAVLGIKYKKLASGAIQHTSVITVLDRRGIVRHRREGSPEGADAALVAALNAVAGERTPRG